MHNQGSQGVHLLWVPIKLARRAAGTCSKNFQGVSEGSVNSRSNDNFEEKHFFLLIDLHCSRSRPVHFDYLADNAQSTLAKSSFAFLWVPLKLSRKA